MLSTMRARLPIKACALVLGRLALRLLRCLIRNGRIKMNESNENAAKVMPCPIIPNPIYAERAANKEPAAKHSNAKLDVKMSSKMTRKRVMPSQR